MDWLFELIGILGSVFVLISFLMKNTKTIRCINIIGAVLFVIYGILIGAVATWFMNGALIVVHIVYLVKEIKSEKKINSKNNN